ncbi:hypothetical protein EAF04_001011 [Stromatinia cepivora]|nr:hypothetical protein EAF04_001011 [Stromatinia cepivora]
MSTSVWPFLPAYELRKEEDDSTERELSWLLESLQDTLASLKTGLEDCYALLAPVEPGSTLVMSSPRSEYLKGHITRVGTQVVKGTLHLRLKSIPPTSFSVSPTLPLVLEPLTQLRNLLNQSLDCVDITRWTGDRHSAPFISSQLHLLHSILTEAKLVLKGPSLLETPTQTPASLNWAHNPVDPDTFSPSLPSNLSLDLTIFDGSLLLTIRVLEPIAQQVNLGSRIAFAIGAQRRLEHDEMDEVFMYKGEEVRVKEKVRVESADPKLMSVLAKVAALEHTVEGARAGLKIVMGGDVEDSEE